MTMQVDINYLAVLVVAIVQFVLGALWYSPVLFAKPWMLAMGKTSEQIKEESQEQNMVLTYSLAFLTALIMAFVVAHVVNYSGATTIGTGIQAGFWMWLGFVVTTNLAAVLFEGRRVGLYVINVGYALVGLLIMGGVLAVWT